MRIKPQKFNFDHIISQNNRKLFHHDGKHGFNIKHVCKVELVINVFLVLFDNYFLSHSKMTRIQIIIMQRRFKIIIIDNIGQCSKFN